MKDQVKSLEEVINTVKGNEKLVLVGMLDLVSQLVERNAGLESKIQNLEATMEQVMKGSKPVSQVGGPSGGGGLSIG